MLYVCIYLCKCESLINFAMERKSFLILIMILVASVSALAQKMSRKEELAALKESYKEAIMHTQELSKELAASVAAIDSLMEVASQLEAEQKKNALLEQDLATAKQQLEHNRNTCHSEGTPVALFFEVGKTSIGAKEVVNLTFFVENSLKLNPDKSFTVYGIQNDLAPQRIEYICNLLHKRYGISKEKIINGGMLGKGEYPGINLNRVVIIK